MSVAGVIQTFKTGTYTVSRRAAGAYDSNGRWVPASPSNFSIDASVQPISGRQLQVLPVALHGEETLVVYTTTQLRTEDENGAADSISIGGRDWTVVNVRSWPNHFEVYVSKPGVP